jgi:hypothetical protein
LVTNTPFLAFASLSAGCWPTRSSRVLGIGIACPKVKKTSANYTGKHGLPLDQLVISTKVCRSLVINSGSLDQQRQSHRIRPDRRR